MSGFIEHQRFPTEIEFLNAETMAQTLDGCTAFWRAPYAVYAHGAEAWVCPYCLSVTDMTSRMPIGPASCTECGMVLQR